MLDRARRRRCDDRGDRQGRRSRRRPRDFFLAGREPFRLAPRDPALYFVQRLRDEAHRFAIGTHRARRKKEFTKSPLDEIAGDRPGAQARAAARFRHGQGDFARAAWPISKRCPASMRRRPGSSTIFSTNGATNEGMGRFGAAVRARRSRVDVLTSAAETRDVPRHMTQPIAITTIRATPHLEPAEPPDLWAGAAVPVVAGLPVLARDRLRCAGRRSAFSSSPAITDFFDGYLARAWSQQSRARPHARPDRRQTAGLGLS